MTEDGPDYSLTDEDREELESEFGSTFDERMKEAFAEATGNEESFAEAVEGLHESAKRSEAEQKAKAVNPQVVEQGFGYVVYEVVEDPEPAEVGKAEQSPEERFAEAAALYGSVTRYRRVPVAPFEERGRGEVVRYCGLLHTSEGTEPIPIERLKATPPESGEPAANLDHVPNGLGLSV